MSMFNLIPVAERNTVPQYAASSLSPENRKTFDAAIAEIQKLPVGGRTKLENAKNYRVAISAALGKGWEVKPTQNHVSVKRLA